MGKLLETGMVVTTHGINGEVRVNPWSDGPEFFLELRRVTIAGRVYPVRYCRAHKNVVLMKLEGIDSIDDAMQLVNQTVYIDRDDVALEEGCYFIADLLGLSVEDADTGERYGAVVDVIKTGANDVYVVRTGTEPPKDLLVPVIKDVVLRVDLAAGRILIRPLPGLFDL